MENHTDGLNHKVSIEISLVKKSNMRTEGGRWRWQGSESCVKGVTQRELQIRRRVSKLRQVGSGGAGNQASAEGGVGSERARGYTCEETTSV